MTSTSPPSPPPTTEGGQTRRLSDLIKRPVVDNRGETLGVTQLVPEEDRLNIGESELHARLIFITHRAREADVQATLRELSRLDIVRSVGSVLRVIDDER